MLPPYFISYPTTERSNPSNGPTPTQHDLMEFRLEGAPARKRRPLVVPSQDQTMMSIQRRRELFKHVFQLVHSFQIHKCSGCLNSSLLH